MLNLTKHIPFVNQQAEFHANMASRFGTGSKYPDLKRSEKHAETAKQFQELITDIDEAGKLPEQTSLPSRQPKQIQLMLSFDELEGLPEELLQELSISGGDRTDYTMLKLIDDLGGIASLDRIIYGLYKQTGEINKRSTITSRLYRMTQKGLIFPVPGKKGVYSTQELSENEALDILN